MLKVLIEFLKKTLKQPEVQKVAKNWFILLLGKSAKTLKDHRSKPENRHHRKNRFLKYNQDILLNLANYDYIQLKEMTCEIKSFLRQIKTENMNNFLENKRTKKWNDILIQLEDYIDNRSYSEFLNLHRATIDKSTFFGNKISQEFKNLTTLEERISYLKQYIKVINFDIAKEFK